jgi:hypothetical protein
MLQQFLKIVHSGSVQSQFEIAQQMAISPDMVLQIARELTIKGYLKGPADNCETEGHACKGCAMGSACNTMVSMWTLTEKGEKNVHG